LEILVKELEMFLKELERVSINISISTREKEVSVAALLLGGKSGVTQLESGSPSSGEKSGKVPNDFAYVKRNS
jgi:hypothetical protein